MSLLAVIFAPHIMSHSHSYGPMPPFQGWVMVISFLFLFAAIIVPAGMWAYAKVKGRRFDSCGAPMDWSMGMMIAATAIMLGGMIIAMIHDLLLH